MSNQLLKTVHTNLLEEHPVISCPLCEHAEPIDKNREDEEYLLMLGLGRFVANPIPNSPIMNIAKCNACHGKFVVEFDLEEKLW